MSLQGTFNTAVQGMNTESHAMSVISTNIANVNTTGYKTARTSFETILNHIQPSQTGAQNFLAVRPVDTQNVSKQGQIQTTQETYDLALNGRGFMITNSIQDGTGVWQYTRDGAMQGKAVTLSTTTNGTTQLDQGTLLTTSGGSYVMGWAANADGTFTETPSLSSLVPIMFQTNATLPFQQTANIQLQANVTSGDAGNRQTVTVPYIDSAGNSQTITVGMTQTLDAGWNLDFTSSDGSPVLSDTDNVAFDSQANLSTPTGGIINLTVNGSSFQDIKLDLSQMTDFAGKGGLTVQNVHQDGYLEGRLDHTYFNSEGVLLGSYTNGELKNLFKLPVATFAAENNLAAMPGNYYVQTTEAGSLFVRGLGVGGTSTGGTAFISGALEGSTVDLADQFSRMIVTQRAYSSNAQVLRTADEMSQAARDLKR